MKVRSGGSAVMLGGEVVICGGVEGVGPRCPLDTCERLVNGRTWTYMEPMQQSRGGLALVHTPPTSHLLPIFIPILVLGGSQGESLCRRR